MSINKNRTIGSWTGLILAAFCASIFLIPAFWNFFNNTCLILGGVQTKAKVIACKEQISGKPSIDEKGNCKSVPIIEFNLKDGTKKSTSPSSSPSNLRIGEELNIVYDSVNPNQVHIGELKHPFTGGSIVLLILGLPFLILTLTIYSNNTFNLGSIIQHLAFVPLLFILSLITWCCLYMIFNTIFLQINGIQLQGIVSKPSNYVEFQTSDGQTHSVELKGWKSTNYSGTKESIPINIIYNPSKNEVVEDSFMNKYGSLLFGLFFGIPVSFGLFSLLKIMGIIDWFRNIFLGFQKNDEAKQINIFDKDFGIGLLKLVLGIICIPAVLVLIFDLYYLLFQFNSIKEWSFLIASTPICLIIIGLTVFAFKKEIDPVSSNYNLDESRFDLLDKVLNEVDPIIEELEAERKNKLFVFIIFILLYILLSFFIVYIIFFTAIKGSFLVKLPVSAIILGSILQGIKYLKNQIIFKNYKYNFKNEIIRNILNQISSDFMYDFENFISLNKIRQSKLFKEANEAKGDDLVKGKIKNTFLEFSEIHLKQVSGGTVESRFISYDTLTRENIIFDGLFIIIDLPKNTKTAFGTLNNISNNKILLDNTEFNELFPVYAENTTEAFYVLPSNLLERMVNFVHKTGRKFDFSVVDDKFYIAIPYNRELLEPPIFKSLFDYSIYEEYLTDLELAIGIVEDLKLT
jgi:Protein of unknown function (DUF3137)